MLVNEFYTDRFAIPLTPELILAVGDEASPLETIVIEDVMGVAEIEL